MVTAMDDQIGRVVEAIENRTMRNNTLIIFQSDNGGTRNAMFAGEVDVSKMKIPCDNGPYREARVRCTKAARGSPRWPTGPATSKPASPSRA